HTRFSRDWSSDVCSSDLTGTMFDKIWDQHVVSRVSEEVDLLHVDRHYAHELTTVEALQNLQQRGLEVYDRGLTFTTLDHVIPTRSEERRVGNACSAGWAS